MNRRNFIAAIGAAMASGTAIKWLPDANPPTVVIEGDAVADPEHLDKLIEAIRRTNAHDAYTTLMTPTQKR